MGGSLDALGAEFGVKREASLPAHQAGSDAFLALKVYLAMESAKMVHTSTEGHVYALEFRQKSAPPSPGVGPGQQPGHMMTGGGLGGGDHHQDLHTPEKARAGKVNYFQQRA
jgi:hypothetical protein